MIKISIINIFLVAWLSGSVLVSINEVNLHRYRLWDMGDRVQVQFPVRKGKGKGAVPNAGHRRGAHLPFLGL